jgi:hypothetical protein
MDYFVKREIANKRLEICKSCSEYIKAITLCNKCKCIMPLKVTLSNSRCPLNKWGQEIFDPSIKEPYNL